jgi:hypothetical protein
MFQTATRDSASQWVFAAVKRVDSPNDIPYRIPMYAQGSHPNLFDTNSSIDMQWLLAEPASFFCYVTAPSRRASALKSRFSIGDSALPHLVLLQGVTGHLQSEAGRCFYKKRMSQLEIDRCEASNWSLK